MLVYIFIVVFVAAASLLVYAVVKIPTVNSGSSDERCSEKRVVDLDFYFKEFEHKINLFLRIRNLSCYPVSDIKGFISVISRGENRSLEPFNSTVLDGENETSVFIAALSPMTRYYVDVKVSYIYMSCTLKANVCSEIYLP
mgnify:CR=1 FL=1